jgi:hypothetical protein
MEGGFAKITKLLARTCLSLLVCRKTLKLKTRSTVTPEAQDNGEEERKKKSIIFFF